MNILTKQLLEMEQYQQTHDPVGRRLREPMGGGPAKGAVSLFFGEDSSIGEPHITVTNGGDDHREFVLGAYEESDYADFKSEMEEVASAFSMQPINANVPYMEWYRAYASSSTTVEEIVAALPYYMEPSR